MLLIRDCAVCGTEVRTYVCDSSPVGAGKYCSRKCQYLGLSKEVQQDDNLAYGSWTSMKNRCLNPKNYNYHNYGARGITVCPEWVESFAKFLEDMGPRPSLLHTLDRFPDPCGNYEPGNCRWATKSEQRKNCRPDSKGRSRLITFLGKTQSIRAWAIELGIKERTLGYRLRSGWPVEQAFAAKRSTRSKRRRV